MPVRRKVALSLLTPLLGAAILLACANLSVVRVAAATPAPARSSHCAAGMARVDGFCVDAYEAYVVEVDAQGRERPHSPYERVAGKNVRAKSVAGVVPQAYVSRDEAAGACASAGKRLCSSPEFSRACRGESPAPNWFPYGGSHRVVGVCNEGKFSAVAWLFGYHPDRWTYEQFNDPRLNQIPNGLARTGAYPRCVSTEGVYDLVGNLAEWVGDAPDQLGHARFRGGHYGEAMANGPGCLYVTSAHEPEYHDYSVGFRCCADSVP